MLCVLGILVGGNVGVKDQTVPLIKVRVGLFLYCEANCNAMVLGISMTMFLFSFFTKVSLDKKQLMKTYKGIEVVYTLNL